MLKDLDSTVRAVLGPTNTGKTHYAIERMLAHRTGVIGLPLRLLAREVYDRIVALRGPSVVALITGEERIVPDRVAYWVCTVEAMPLDIGADFVAIDEIQLCADPDRGHVFTDRLLHCRGAQETIFLGADTMRARIANLVPRAEFRKRDRFSKLTYSGSKKISRMPARSAVVGFSVDDVYAIAEVIRRMKGGAAVVMGALSPRTRNAQVAMYQNGDVDYLVATDAIGMGLNLDIAHVAFSGDSKFDGRRMRRLMPHELGQIAGRAGRYRTDGSFGVTGEVVPFEPEIVTAIEESRFAPISRLQWRNRRLDFGSAPALIRSLEEAPDEPVLVRAREADDLASLRALAELTQIKPFLNHPQRVRLLWDVCQIPDFRKLSRSDHIDLLARIFGFLSDGNGRIPADWLSAQVKRIDKTSGDIDALSKRLAFIRTWTYVTQRSGWVDDAPHWQGETRAVEDRLSDALHAALTQRFVDRRTSVLLRRLKQRESLVAEIDKDGDVHVDAQFIGKLEGFRFRLDPKATGEEAKTLRSAAEAALQPEFNLRADRMYNAPDAEFDVTEQGGLMWGADAVGKLVRGGEVLTPQVEVFVDDEAGADVAEKVRRRLSHWIDRRITALFEPLFEMKKDETLTGLAKGLGFQLIETLGVMPRSVVADDVKALDQDARGLLRKHGVRFGQFTLFMPLLLKPAPTRMRLLLTAIFEGADEYPEAPPPGLVTIPAVPGAEDAYYSRAGYRLAGTRAIRIDMAERLADMIRSENTRAGFEASADMLSITGLTLDQFADLLQGMGYRAVRDERQKVRPEKAATDAPVDDTASAGDAKSSDTKSSGDAATGAEAKPAAPSTETDDPVAAELAAKTMPDAVADDTAETPAAPDTGAGSASEAGADAGQNDAPEMEVFYTFTWGGQARERRQQNKPQQDGQKRRPPKGKRGDKKPKSESAKKFRAAPPKRKTEIDPDNPFAALAALKEK